MAKELEKIVEKSKDIGYEATKYGAGFAITGGLLGFAIEGVGRIPVVPPVYEALTAGLGPIPEVAFGFLVLAGAVAVKDRFVDRFVAHHAPASK